MKYSEWNNFYCFEFSAELKPSSKIQCPECEKFSLATEWAHSEIGCELCGSHSAIVCPECDEHLDHVWTDTLVII